MTEEVSKANSKIVVEELASSAAKNELYVNLLDR